MKTIKMIFFSAMPLALCITYFSMLDNSLTGGKSQASGISLVFTLLLLLIIVVQFIVKDTLYFPVVIFASAAAVALTVMAVPEEEFFSVIQGNIFLRSIVLTPQKVLYSFMLLTASLPQLFNKQPFTVYFAKLTVPEPFQETKLFRSVNNYISFFWAGIFILCLAAQYLPGHKLQVFVPVAVQVLIGIPGTTFLQPYLISKLAGTVREENRNFIKTARDAVSGMTYMFNKKASEGIEAVFQFIISGDENFDGYLEVKNMQCSYHEGIHRSPTLIIKSSDEVWLKIAREELSGQDAFLEGLYSIKGDFSSVPLLNTLFKRIESKPVKTPVKPVTAKNTGLREMFDYEYKRRDPGSIKKVLAITGSPRKQGTSKTDMVVQAFLEGCRNAGAETETIYLSEKKISHCIGCFTCWTKTPGVCVFRDDVADIMAAENNADLVVYASPLYHFGIMSLLKKYIERTLPKIKPYFIETSGGRTTHPIREGYKELEYTVIIGVCGFPEVSHFGAFSANFHYIAEAGGDHGMKIMAELYRPYCEVLGNPFYKEENDRVLSLTFKAGEQAVKEGSVSTGIMKEISEVRLDIPAERKVTNKSWDMCIQRNITMPQMQEFLRKRNETGNC